ncbi:YjjG family noncanonical pyrimidine nucleotidase [Cellulophaga baltica]|uniref:YjjG family noncanonical pyrimidine nucleotidase n=1 Tax=Cellulophaga TaxID=104264 RepID=UPI001C0759EF|nr:MULTISPECIES: YjjG family noncanonical pyrimidine nucleotidase [Cellulophaga]MBU2997079.1 YjjG family noncanonical pyrimidine nucleotidase [Cellulophaga baltica]MDO6768477.1 YjjG family noncanonical pyrimidine nucleotidase [Cellulophaga sp. 1_MG-2023]
MYSKLVTDVFFDLDHTLWDFEKNSALTFSKILSENKIMVSLDDFLRVYVPNNLVFWKLFRENNISKEDLRYQRLKTTFDTLGVEVKDELIYQLSDDYIANLSSYNHLFPHAIEILDYLKPKYKLHVITNGFNEVQNRKIKNSKIDRYFTHIIDSEMAGVKKPNPIIFKLALEKANVLPEHSLMIGDSIEADILGAQACGFHTLHFNAHNEDRHEFCDMITELSEIKTYL